MFMEKALKGLQSKDPLQKMRAAAWQVRNFQHRKDMGADGLAQLAQGIHGEGATADTARAAILAYLPHLWTGTGQLRVTVLGGLVAWAAHTGDAELDQPLADFRKEWKARTGKPLNQWVKEYMRRQGIQ